MGKSTYLLECYVAASFIGKSVSKCLHCAYEYFMEHTAFDYNKKDQQTRLVLV